jgi:hypothetical protein
LTLLACLTHSLYCYRFVDFYSPDSSTYLVPAANLAAGRGFIDAAGRPDTLRTPGYPVLIVPFLLAGLNLKYLIVFQHAVAILVTIATSALLLRLTGNTIQAFLSGLILCLDFPFLNAANSILTETCFTAALGVTCYLLFIAAPAGRRTLHLSAAAGLFAGASVLIRPIALLFFVPAVIFVVCTSFDNRLRRAFAFVVAFSILPVGWTVRNYHEQGYLGVSSISGFTMVLRGAAALAINDPGEFEVNYADRIRQLKAQACEDIVRVLNNDCDAVTPSQRADYESRLGSKLVSTHPFAYVRVMARGTAIMMLGGDREHLSQLVGRWATPIILSVTAPAFGLALVGLGSFRRSHTRFACLAALTIGYFVLLSAGAEAYSRHRVPIDPMYAMLIAAGVGRLFPNLA